MGREGSHEPLLIDHRIQFTERKFRLLDNLLRLRVLDASVKKALGSKQDPPVCRLSQRQVRYEGTLCRCPGQARPG